MRVGLLLLMGVMACTSSRIVDEPVPLQGARLVLVDSGEVLSGEPPRVRVANVRVGDTVELRARRFVPRTQFLKDVQVTDTITVESWARFVATSDGVDPNAATPMAGTWREADAMALFWSMREVPNDSLLRRLRTSNAVTLTLAQNGLVRDSGTLMLHSSLDSLDERVILGGNFVGAFAVRRGARAAPVVLALHGSEGGDTVAARALARRFAARGYAAFAVSYVQYPWNGALPGVPTAFDSIPVETLDRARAWLGQQPQADTSRTALWGVSKGAEFALVASARRDWVRAAVACVPSDVMWAGYGRDPLPGETLASWSDSGRRLPAIPYDRYDDVFAGKATPRQVHDRSRVASPALARAARIPVEQIVAPVLVLGADRDNVWSSGEMTRSAARSLSASTRQAPVSAHTYPDADHYICGVGTTPVSLLGPDSAPISEGTARSAADAWQRTLAFLAEHFPATPKR